MTAGAGIGVFVAILLACVAVGAGVVVHGLPPDPCDDRASGGSVGFVDGGYVDGRFAPAVPVRDPAAVPPRVRAIKTRYSRPCVGTVVATDYALRGISPRLATRNMRAGGGVTVAPGSMTILDGYPLRAALWGDKSLPRPFPARCRRGQVVRRRAVVFGPPAGGFLPVRGSNLQVDLQRSTVVTGRRFEGIPAARRGDRILVTGHECRGRKHPRRVRMLADRVALPG